MPEVLGLQGVLDVERVREMQEALEEWSPRVEVFSVYVYLPIYASVSATDGLIPNISSQML
jgi:hypothetical protein